MVSLVHLNLTSFFFLCWLFAIVLVISSKFFFSWVFLSLSSRAAFLFWISLCWCLLFTMQNYCVLHYHRYTSMNAHTHSPRDPNKQRFVDRIDFENFKWISFFVVSRHCVCVCVNVLCLGPWSVLLCYAIRIVIVTRPAKTMQTIRMLWSRYHIQTLDFSFTLFAHIHLECIAFEFPLIFFLFCCRLPRPFYRTVSIHWPLNHRYPIVIALLVRVFVCLCIW